MREFLVIALTSCDMFGSSVPAIGQETGARVTLPILPPLSGKWTCVIEKAAGVLYREGAKESTPQAVKFQEQNRRFVLTIRRIVRDQFERDYCRATLSHWMPILAEKKRWTSGQSFLPGAASGSIRWDQNYRDQLKM
jgi:hypothetical protein